MSSIVELFFIYDFYASSSWLVLEQCYLVYCMANAQKNKRQFCLEEHITLELVCLLVIISFFTGTRTLPYRCPCVWS